MSEARAKIGNSGGAAARTEFLTPGFRCPDREARRLKGVLPGKAGQQLVHLGFD
jgi:hypothetical protein